MPDSRKQETDWRENCSGGGSALLSKHNPVGAVNTRYPPPSHTLALYFSLWRFRWKRRRLWHRQPTDGLVRWLVQTMWGGPGGGFSGAPKDPNTADVHTFRDSALVLMQAQTGPSGKESRMGGALGGWMDGGAPQKSKILFFSRLSSRARLQPLGSVS